MQILVPLKSRDDIESLKKAGADELYLGFYDEAWTENFGPYANINRMSGFDKHANPYNFSESCTIVDEIKRAGMHAFVTLNANAYSKDQIHYIEDNYFPMLLSHHVNGVIVSTEQLAKSAVDVGLNAVASTMMGIYNFEIAKYYEHIGVKRMILPRDLSLAEIGQIKSKIPDVDIEVFFMRNGCIFSDGYCLGSHRVGCGSTCGMLGASEKRIASLNTGFSFKHDVELNDFLYHNYFHRSACGMCALYRLNEMGVSALKIVGRADNPHGVIEDVRLTKENMAILNDCVSEKEYLQKMILPKGFAQCSLGLSCYYPEVRFGENARE